MQRASGLVYRVICFAETTVGVVVMEHGTSTGTRMRELIREHRYISQASVDNLPLLASKKLYCRGFHGISFSFTVLEYDQ